MTSENSSKTTWKNKAIILGSGYIGTYLAEYLKDTNWDVKLISSSTLDYHDPSSLNKYLFNEHPYVVINCSGFTGKPNVDEGESKKEQCWFLNVISPLQVNTVCNRLGIKYVHISSGCIYTGYEKDFEENDKPNFGLFDESSFYSKSKHAFELMSKELTNKIIRIRMPLSPDNHERSYLTKLLKYDNLIDFRNSKTYIPDLCIFTEKLLEIDDFDFWKKSEIYNVVNPNPLSTVELIKIMKEKGKYNPNWNIVDISKLNMKAPRSNCVLNGSKADSIYQMRDEEDILRRAIK